MADSEQTGLLSGQQTPPLEAPSCRMTRFELQDILEKCNFGQNEAMFNCYFLPKSSPPVCVSCQRRVAEHPASNNGSAGHHQQAEPYVAQATMMPPNTTTIQIPVGRPKALTTDPTNPNIDRLLRPYPVILLIVAAGIYLLAIGLFACFLFTGLLVSGGVVVLTGPIIQFLVATMLLCICKKVSVTFDKSTHQVFWNTRYLLGCSSQGSCDFSQLGVLEERPSGRRYTRLFCKLNSGGEFLLDYYYIGDTTQRLAWAGYLAQLQQQQQQQQQGAVFGTAIGDQAQQQDVYGATPNTI